MEDGIKKELMEIERALEEEQITLGEGIFKIEQPIKTEKGLPFKKPALFTCSMCDKKFTQVNYSKTHERIHSGEKPFSCSKCDKSFTTAGNLKTHERIHSGDKPFSCSQCEFKCSKPGNLKRHETSHTVHLLSV